MSRKMVAILLSVVFTTSVLGGCGSKGRDKSFGWCDTEAEKRRDTCLDWRKWSR